MMIQYKGRTSSIKQYIRGKPHPWGFKIWARTSSSGIRCDFDVYQGGDGNRSELEQGADVVLHLAASLPSHQNFKIYAHNFFTSVPLVEKLMDIIITSFPLIICVGFSLFKQNLFLQAFRMIRCL